ncbi:MAG: sigma-54-dependent Fis family transcriptional regulator [bacterium]|nr:sigma-54-dependent Fis family transcriptional regulator [bacterium]
MKYKVLVVDDEETLRTGIRRVLQNQAYEVEEAATCEKARELLQFSLPDAAIIDYRLPDGTALDLLDEAQKLTPPVPVIILTGHGSVDLAVRAIKEGAENFLTKPVEMPALLVILERITERRRKHHKELALHSTQPRQKLDPFRGTSAAIKRLTEDARRMLDSVSPILVEGETGVGKGLLARWLHDNGPRGDEPFVDLNCAALSQEFLESELFGHQRGAFTGAAHAKAGLLEVAHNGTAFLDEIGDVDIEIQSRILKVLEEKRFRRLGEVRDRQVDIRLIAATHQDIKRLVREQKFRSDLYFRISTLPLTVPALRERVEDIPLLARDILKTLAAARGRPGTELSPSAEKMLQRYSWPGNIRELRNVLERAILLTDDQRLEPQNLRFDSGLELPEDREPPGDALIEVERRHIERILRDESGRVYPAADRLGIPVSTLYKKIKRYDLKPSRSQPSD